MNTDETKRYVEPVAWLVDGPFEKRVVLTRREAYVYRSGLPEIETASMCLYPLYRHTTLTDAERKGIAIHDAAPAARAQPDTAGRDSDHVAGTGDTLTDAERAAVAWTIDLGDGNVYDIQNFQWEAEAIAAALLKNEGVIAKAVPLYRHPQPTLTDAERATLQWYCDYCVGGEHAEILRGLLERLTPLEGSQQDRCTLTDAEREALLGVADDAAYRGAEYTEQMVRGLLERTKEVSDE